MRSIIKILLISLYGIVSVAGTIDPSTPDHKYVEYGKKFSFVAKICGKYKDGSKYCASAVVIDEHHVLTAAHVVENSISCLITLDNDKEFLLDSMIIHQDFDYAILGSSDIALGYSSNSFELETYPTLYDKTDEINKICSIAGYGFTGTFHTGAKIYDNKKRAGYNVIFEVSPKMLRCNPSRRIDYDYRELEFFIASGDSGGGLFIGDSLAGINSCIMAVDKAPRSKYNEESMHSRISHFIPWINDNKTKK